MSAQTTIERLRKALAASQENETAQAEALRELIDIAKSSPEGMALVTSYYREVVKSDRSTIAGAIEGALFDTPDDPFAPSPVVKAAADAWAKDLQEDAEKIKKGTAKREGGVRWSVGPQDAPGGRG
jgi:hypothetical protein